MRSTTGRATPARDLIDGNAGYGEPTTAVGALDPDTCMALQRAPFRLLLLSEAESARRDLNEAGCSANVENFVVAGRHLLVERLWDAQTCHEVNSVCSWDGSRCATIGSEGTFT